MMAALLARPRFTAHFTTHSIFETAWGAFVVLQRLKKLAPEVGLEPTTTRLTAACSTIELLWNPNRQQFI